MRHIFVLLTTLFIFSASAIGWIAAQQPSVTGPTVDEVLLAVRTDLQANRADVLAKNLTFNAEQAAKFWPLYESYQKEQNVILDAQLKGIQQYIDSIDHLDDAAALGLMHAHLERDAKMVALRQKWLGDFQKAVGAKLAVRAMQIDRRLSLAYQLQTVSRIPLAR